MCSARCYYTFVTSVILSTYKRQQPVTHSVCNYWRAGLPQFASGENHKFFLWHKSRLSMGLIYHLIRGYSWSYSPRKATDMWSRLRTSSRVKDKKAWDFTSLHPHISKVPQVRKRANIHFTWRESILRSDK